MTRISWILTLSSCALLLSGCPSKPKGTTATPTKTQAPLASSNGITATLAKKQQTKGYTTRPALDVSTIKNTWRYDAKTKSRICLVHHWPKQARMIVVHTKQTCETARVQAGAFELVDTSTQKAQTNFEGYLHHTEDDQYALIVKDKEPAILSIKDGQVTSLKTKRQASLPRSKRRILLDAKTHTLWTFERTGEEQEKIYMRALKIEDLQQVQSIDQKAFFWPNPSLDRYRTTDKQLYVSPTEKIEGERCALALYHLSGASTCVQSQTRADRYIWRPEYALTLDAETKKLRLNTYQKQPIATPLPDCKVDRLRAELGQSAHAKDYALIQCQGSQQTILWRPNATKRVKLPGNATDWHMLPSMPDAQHTYRFINLKTKQQIVLDALNERLWSLPDQLRLRSESLAVEKPTQGDGKWSVWSTTTLPNLALVTRASCEGNLSILPTEVPSQTLMVCTKKDARSCESSAQLWVTRIDHKTKTLTPIQGGLPTASMWAMGAHQNGPTRRCPGHALMAPSRD